MINANYNLTDLKAALYDSFSKTKVSKTVCVGARPGATKGIDDFVVIRVISSMKDKGGIGNTVCRIELYARDIYSYENPERLKEMFLSCNDALFYLSENYPKYTFESSEQVDRGSDGLDFHSISIDLFTTIKN